MGTIYVAGHSGLVGSALVRALESRKMSWSGQTHAQLDLLDRDSVFSYIHDTKPEAVVIAAARVGGIIANVSHPVEFLSENIRISTNIIDACHAANIQKVLFLGSSCIYPRMAPQPIKEEYLLTGPLEPTNESYALAKISGLKLIEAYRKEYGRQWISAMPTNLYGPGDNFDLQTSHVLPATIRKFVNAVENGTPVVEMWGTGTPRREFLHVDDLANACLHLLEIYNEDLCINVGTGTDIEIRELAQMVSQIVGFQGKIEWNVKKPDGMPRKLLDVTRIRNTGWHPVISLQDGLEQVYKWFKTNVHNS
jgi:GDP-L-fucose synthase